MNVLFILTGSIACYKACDAISQLVQRGHRVRVVATQAALRFVGVATLEGLTREKVATDLFAAGEALEHITLARWADVTIVCPATANTLNRMAAGLADDLASALLLAHDWQKPLLLAPAMNPSMWSHPATVASLAKLQGWGARLVAPGAGRTACGEVGEGRLAEPEEIVATIEAAGIAPARRLRVLITSGGTSEPIDGVRVLTNTSTGATGALIAKEFARAGHHVTLVRAANAPAVPGVTDQEIFTTFADLDAALQRQLGAQEFDAIIHAAAVGDFAVESVEVAGEPVAATKGKISSAVAPVIRLRKNPKLLDSLRARSCRSDVKIVGFKLTRGAAPAAIAEAVRGVLASGADFVVHNDLAVRTPDGAFPADIWREGAILEHCADRAALAASLVRLLGGAVERPGPRK